jgi:hypothetical protein
MDANAYHLRQLSGVMFQLLTDTYQQSVLVNEIQQVLNHLKVVPQTLAKSQEFQAMPLADKDRDIAYEIKQW